MVPLDVPCFLARLFKRGCVSIYANACVAYICVCVMVGAFVLTLPVWCVYQILLKIEAMLQSACGNNKHKHQKNNKSSSSSWLPYYYYRYTTLVETWVSTVSYAVTLVLGGNRVFCCESDGQSLDLLHQAKQKNSVVLANHGSRIDWMIALFICHCKDENHHVEKPTAITQTRTRSGFVCEATHQVRLSGFVLSMPYKIFVNLSLLIFLDWLIFCCSFCLALVGTCELSARTSLYGDLSNRMPPLLATTFSAFMQPNRNA